MDKRVIQIFLSVALTITLYLQVTQAQVQQLPQYSSTRILLKFHSDSPHLLSARIIASKKPMESLQINDFKGQNEFLYSILKKASVYEIKPLSYNITTESLPGGIERIFTVELDGTTSVEEAICKLKDTGEFEFVEKDYIGHGAGEKCHACKEQLSPALFIPNDPLFVHQWALFNNGQVIGGSRGNLGADINITRAWEISAGANQIVLAILDSGIPSNAEDFTHRTIPGFDFANEDNFPIDDHGHGTNVTSIAAATGNNRIAMAGVNWNSQIVHFKVLNNQNRGYYSWWIRALIAAANKGAHVINLSLGGTQPSQALHSAVQYAAASGAIIIASMMNSNNEIPFFPAAYPEVIAVGATNNLDLRAVPFCFSTTSGSNFGNHIDFVAPGERILGLHFQNPSVGTLWCGTSQATPIVAGVVSLMLSLKPELTFDQIFNILRVTARDQIGHGWEDTPGWDRFFGWGRIDAHAALQRVNILVHTGKPFSFTNEFKLYQNFPNPFNLSTTIRYTIPNVNDNFYPKTSNVPFIKPSSNVTLKVFDVFGRKVATLIDKHFKPGKFEVTWNAEGFNNGVYWYRLQFGSFSKTRKLVILR